LLCRQALQSPLRSSQVNAGVARRLNFRFCGQSSDNGAMTATGKHIVEEFDSLADSEKREVLADLLRIARDIDYPESSDDELLAAADAVFEEYDAAENEN
jgi:hypothetical protein